MTSTPVQRALRSTTSRFAKDERGGFAIMFIAATVAVGTAVGLAVDVSRMFSIETRLANAVDAAVLGTTRAITKGSITPKQAEKQVAQFVFANFDSQKYGITPTITGINIDTTAKTLSVSAHVDMPLSFMQIAGYATQRIDWTSAAAFSDTKIEVAMALDVTGSMNDPIPVTGTKKIAALKNAASKGIDALIPDADAAKRVRIGLVPYAATVDAGPVIGSVSTTAATAGCVFERTGTEAHTDAFADVTNPLGGTYSGCPGAKILPLTNSATALKSRINSFTTAGCTAGHTAIAWTYYMLSPSWNTAWPTASDVAPYTDTKTRKYAIVMTDGIFNTHISSGEVCNNAGKTKSRADALALCGAMKAREIKVYTIAFAAPTKAGELMDDCANDDTAESKYYYNATNEAGLKAAFESIARDIQKLRLIN
ncbi:MAG: TadE/TadG family type IV pilus assembly protein [Pseudomonadota bacterium]